MSKINQIVWSKEELNKEELSSGYVSFRHVVERFVGDIVLCNSISEVDFECIYNELVGSLYDEEADEYLEVFQYYLCNVSQSTIDYLNSLGQDDIIIVHSNLLDVDVLCVTHYGTSWDYVSTSFPTNIK